MTPKTTEAEKTILQGQVKKRVCLYARTSSDDTARDSLTWQLEECEKYANANGYVIIERLQEDIKGVKGDDRNAPALNEALTMAKAGRFDVLIIRDVKRYSRDVYKAMDFERQFFDNGIEIEYVWNQELNGLPRRGTGSMIRFLQYWVSEQDREDVVKKLYLKRVDSVKRLGSVMTQGRAPYGYAELVITEGRTKRRTLVIKEDEAKWIVKIFEWYVIEGITLNAIQIRLKEHCVPKPSAADSHRDPAGKNKRTSFDWQRSTIRTILKRRTYIGEWEWSKDSVNKRKALGKSIIADSLAQTISVTVPAIIPIELFEAAQVKLGENKLKTQKKSEYEFLMRGRAKCGLCGFSCRCIAKKWGERIYIKYACTPRWGKVPHPETGEICTLPYFERDIIDAEIWDWLKRLMNDEAELEKGYQDYLADKETKIEPLQDELKRIGISLAEFNGKLIKQAQALTMLQEIGSTHAADVIKQDILQIENMIDRYQAEKNRIEAELEQVTVNKEFITDFRGFVAAIREAMLEADKDFNKRRKIIEALNTTVEFTVEDNQPVFYPKCVFKKADLPILYNSSRTVIQDRQDKPGQCLILTTRIVYQPQKRKLLTKR